MRAIVVTALILCLVLCDAIDINQHLARRKRTGDEKTVEVKIGGNTMTCPFRVTEGGSLAQGLVAGADAPDLAATVKIGSTAVNIRKCAFHDKDGGFILSCEGGRTKWTALPSGSTASSTTKGECDHIISALAATTQTYKYELAQAGPINLPVATRNVMIGALPGVTIDAIRGAVSLVPTAAPVLSADDQALVDAVIALISQGQPTSNLDAGKLQQFFDAHKKVATVYQMPHKEIGYNDPTLSDKQQHDHRVAFENAITNTPSDRNGFASAYEKARRPIYTAQNFDSVPNGAYDNPNYGKCALHLKLSVLMRSILYTDNTLMYGTNLYLNAKGDPPEADTFRKLMDKLFAHKGDWDQSVGTLRTWYRGNAEVKKRIGFVPTMLFDMGNADQLALARGALMEYARAFPKGLLGKPHAPAKVLQASLGDHVPEALVYGGLSAADVEKITCRTGQDTAAFAALAADGTHGAIPLTYI